MPWRRLCRKAGFKTTEFRIPSLKVIIPTAEERLGRNFTSEAAVASKKTRSLWRPPLLTTGRGGTLPAWRAKQISLPRFSPSDPNPIISRIQDPQRPGLGDPSGCKRTRRRDAQKEESEEKASSKGPLASPTETSHFNAYSALSGEGGLDLREESNGVGQSTQDANLQSSVQQAESEEDGGQEEEEESASFHKRQLLSSGLCRELQDAFSSQGFCFLTQVQRRALQPILAGATQTTTFRFLGQWKKKQTIHYSTRQSILQLSSLASGKSVYLRSATGTGKTLAYLLPILQKIHSDKWPAEEPVIVLAPTRELAEQIFTDVHRFRGEVRCRAALLVGGESERYQREIVKSQGVHLAVATPGRLVALAKNGDLLHLSELRVLVLDEADRLVGRAFEAELAAFFESLNPHRQTVLVSATLSPWVSGKPLEKAFGFKNAESPLIIDLVKEFGAALPSSLPQRICRVPKDPGRRARSVAFLLQERLPPDSQAIVFCNTKQQTALLVSHPLLQHARALHADMNQEQRRKTVEDFRESKFTILVTSDLAARGLDFPRVKVVVQDGPPFSPEVYIHRAGRTGRGGEEGESILLFDEAQRKSVRRLENLLKISFLPLQLPSEAQVQETLLSKIGRHATKGCFHCQVLRAFPRVEIRHFFAPVLFVRVEAENELSNLCRLEGDEFVREIAESLWKSHGPKVLAAAMAMLLQRQRRLAWRSCLSGRLNCIPVLLEDPLGLQIKSRGELMQLLRRALSESQMASVGRIALTIRGFVVDLPPTEATALSRSPALKALAVKAVFIASLPPILNDQQRVLGAPDGTQSKTARKHRRRLRTTRLPSSPRARRRRARRLARETEKRHVLRYLRKQFEARSAAASEKANVKA